MPYTVKVDHPSVGDSDIYIHGLGTFRNGTETEVDDDQVMRFRIMNATQVMSDFNETGGFSMEQQLGPDPSTLDILGVTVTKNRGDVNVDSSTTVEGDVNVNVETGAKVTKKGG
jgi:hypothetical protein